MQGNIKRAGEESVKSGLHVKCAMLAGAVKKWYTGVHKEGLSVHESSVMRLFKRRLSGCASRRAVSFDSDPVAPASYGGNEV